MKLLQGRNIAVDLRSGATVDSHRRCGLLRWMLVLGALGFSPAAIALEPDDLPFGVWVDLVDCLEDADTAACETAASAVGDPAWAAFIRGRGSEELGADDKHLWLALSCASEDASACAVLAAQDLDSKDPMTRYRGAAEAQKACALGSSVGCGISGNLGNAGAKAWERLLIGETDFKSLPATLAKASKACATSKTPGVECANLAAAAFASSDSKSALAQTTAAVRAACDKDDESATCALAIDLGEPEGPYDPLFTPSLRLAEELCVDDLVGRACTIASGLLSLGRFTPHGTLGSLSYQQLACNAEQKSGCQHITDVLRSERLTTFQTRCDAATTGNDDPRACTMLSIALQFGVGIPTDKDRAAQVEGDACEYGDPSACLWRADKLWDDDELAAYSWYRKACDAGSGLSCGIVGRMEWKGESGVPEDKALATTHLRRGVAIGASYPMLILGNLLFDDGGETEAFGLYGRACALGDLEACGSVAVMVMYQYETSVGMADAQQLAIAACNRDEFYSCAYLATLWTTPDSPVPRDEARARWAAGKACEGAPDDPDDNDSEACKLLTELGDGPVTKDTGRSMPRLRRGVSFLVSEWSAAYDPEPVEVVRPGPGPGPSPGPGPGPGPIHLGGGSTPWLMLSYGSQRSWTQQAQASALRASFGLPIHLLLVGADLDLVTDSRWHPKVTRTYWRTTAFLNVGLSLPFSDAVKLELAVGPGLGGFRAGPGDTQPIALSYGLHELLQLRVQFDDFTVGVRVEEHQLWNQGTPGIDHITGVYGLLGVAFD